MKTADYAHIPSDLKASAEWFLFKRSNGKPQLFSYRGKAIDTVNPRASGTFKEVCAEGQRAQYDGLATVVKGGDIKYFHTEASTPAPTVPGAEPKAATPKAQHAPASVSATSPTADAQRAVMVSGFGQFHTNEPDPDKPNKKLTPYQHITFDGIRALVDNPQQVDKAQAQWLIPSSLQSRDFKRQEVEGQFWMLWADFDTDPQSVERVAQAVDLVTGGSDYEVYNSRGATVNRPKSRALIVLANPLSGGDWVVCQQVLNDKLKAQGLSTDRASERAAQLCYLPNRGAHYESRSQRDGVLFDPLAHWADEIRAKRKAIAEADAELRARKEDAQTRKAAIASAPGTQGRSLIDAFNECFTVQDILLRNGYVQRGDAFRHPGSESGSYSAGVKNGRVNALSPNDPLFTDCKGAHDAFSAFKMLEHGGDHDAALKDAGDNWLVIGGEPWNKVRRREYAQEKAAAELAKVDLSSIMQSVGAAASVCDSEKSDAGTTPQQPIPSFVFVPARDLVSEPTPVVYLVDELIEHQSLALLFAPPSSGKSFLAISWAASVATGTPWLERDTRQGPVFYLAGEGHAGLSRRFKAWELQTGVSLADAPLYVSKVPAALMDAGSAAMVERAIEHLSVGHGAPALIVVDTFARNMGKGNENDNADIGIFVNNIDQMRHRLGCSVLLVHHTGHMEGDRARGGSALPAAMDACFLLESKKSGSMTLTQKKAKEAELCEPIGLALCQVPIGWLDTKGREMNSAVMVAADAEDLAIPRSKPLTPRQQEAMQAFFRAVVQSNLAEQVGNEVGIHVESWRIEFNRTCTAENAEAKRKAFQRARDGLVKRGCLRVDFETYFARQDEPGLIAHRLTTSMAKAGHGT